MSKYIPLILIVAVTLGSCSKRIIFTTIELDVSWVLARSRGVTVPVASVGGSSRSPIKNVTVSPVK